MPEERGFNMCFKVINYIDIVNKAMLDSLDSYDDKCIIQDKIYLDLNKEFQKLLEFYMISNLKNETYFGKQNIIISTCKPYNNWRKELRGHAIKSNKFKLTDKSINTNTIKLDNILDKIYNNLKNTFKTNIFIDNEKMDIFDIILAFNRLLPGYKPSKASYYIIEDGNIEYIHNNMLPDYLLNELESKLIKYQILI